jgi:hypothetical protein
LLDILIHLGPAAGGAAAALLGVWLKGRHDDRKLRQEHDERMARRYEHGEHRG